MRPSIETLTKEFRAIAARKIAAGETFDAWVLDFWKKDGVDVDALLSEMAA